MGAWCSAGILIPCPMNSYNNLTSRSDQGACTACPDDAVAPVGSSSFDACLCEVGFYLDAEAECQTCPLPGTSCNESGTTLETLPLAQGFWRPPNASSLDVRQCPDYDEAGGDASGCGGHVSPCKADRDLAGVYCRTCTNASTYYVSSECRPCDPLVERWIAVGLGVAFGVLALVLFGAGLWSRQSVRKCLRTLQQRTSGMLWRAVRRFSLTSKIKVAWGFYQIVGQMGAVYHLNTLPENVAPLLDAIETGISLGFDGLSSLLGCVGFSSKVNTLTFYIIAPMLLVLIASAAIMLRAAARRRGNQSWVRQALLATLRPALLVSFCAYPIVASVAFQAFACEPLGDVAKRYLPPDYSLECGPEGKPTDEFTHLTNVAIVAIVIYPVGISLTTALLLYIARVPLRAGRSTDFTQAISFLHEEYEPTFFWWELVEQLKKLLLIGFAVFVTPVGSLIQLVFGLIVGLGFLVSTFESRPYVHASDNSVAGFFSFSLVLFFSSVIVFKVQILIQAVDSTLSEYFQHFYRMDTNVLSAIMIASLVGGLAISLLAFLLHMNAALRKARQAAATEREASAARGRLSHPPTTSWQLRQGNRYCMFLSHFKVEAGSDARCMPHNSLNPT